MSGINSRFPIDSSGPLHRADHHDLHHEDVLHPEAALPTEPTFPSSKAHPKSLRDEEKMELLLDVAALKAAIKGHQS